MENKLTGYHLKHDTIGSLYISLSKQDLFKIPVDYKHTGIPKTLS